MQHNSFVMGAVAGACTCVGVGVAYNMMKGESADPVQREQEHLNKQKDRAGLVLSESKSVYFEGVPDYKIILTKEEIDEGVQHVADEIEKRFKGEKIVLCGILKGAFIFITDLCRRLNRPYSLYFVEASSYTGQTQSESVELLSRIVPSKFEGRKIVLVDELLDNGHTMNVMKDYLMKTLNVPRSDIATCVLFKKVLATRPKEYEPDICGFGALPNLWLVGYGLDDNGTKRGWTELYAKPKCDGVPRVEADTIFKPGPEGRAMQQTLRKTVLAELRSKSL